MRDLFLLTTSHMARSSTCVPLTHDVPHADDTRMVSGIIYVICKDLQ